MGPVQPRRGRGGSRSPMSTGGGGLRRGALGVLLLLVAAGLCGAAQPQPLAWEMGDEPLQVDSETLEVRGDENRVVFEGDVVARQGDVTLQADRLEVEVESAARTIRSVHAVGNVRVERQELVATGQEGRYDALQGVVVLTGEPKVWRGRDVVAGQRILLYLAENRSVVEGARAVLYPNAPPGEPPP